MKPPSRAARHEQDRRLPSPCRAAQRRSPPMSRPSTTMLIGVTSPINSLVVASNSRRSRSPALTSIGARSPVSSPTRTSSPAESGSSPPAAQRRGRCRRRARSRVRLRRARRVTPRWSSRRASRRAHPATTRRPRRDCRADRQSRSASILASSGPRTGSPQQPPVRARGGNAGSRQRSDDEHRRGREHRGSGRAAC